MFLLCDYISQDEITSISQVHRSRSSGSLVQSIELLIVKIVRVSSAKSRNTRGGGVAQWLGHRISDQGVPGSNPGQCTFRCGLEQVTFTLLSTG